MDHHRLEAVVAVQAVLVLGGGAVDYQAWRSYRGDCVARAIARCDVPERPPLGQGQVHVVPVGGTVASTVYTAPPPNGPVDSAPRPPEMRPLD